MSKAEPEPGAELRRRAQRVRSLARGLSPEDQERLLKFAAELDARAAEMARDSEVPDPDQ